MLSLLLGFIAPQSGEIRLDGVPLASLSRADAASRLAWVPQKPYLFNDTLLANLILARPDASMEDVRRAAALAHADEFIRRLPLGYDTPIGEGGARLSGGQAQRLALARAFLQDAPLLLLDEATANLDPATEAQVSASLERLLVGRTALVAAHRLSTLSRLDRILVLDGGRVIQQGSHVELAQAPGLYRRMLGAWASASPRCDSPSRQRPSSPSSRCATRRPAYASSLRACPAAGSLSAPALPRRRPSRAGSPSPPSSGWRPCSAAWA